MSTRPSTRLDSITRTLKKFQPVNCSKGRYYLEPLPMPPSHRPSPRFSPSRRLSAHAAFPADTSGSREANGPEEATRNVRHRRVASVLVEGEEDARRGKLKVADCDRSLGEGRVGTCRAELRSRRTCSCGTPDPLSKTVYRKSTKRSTAACERLTAVISKCQEPERATELWGDELKLSVSFEDLRECLRVTKEDAGRKEVKISGDVAQTIKQIRRQKRDENRNVGDKATLQTLVDEKREVSNYIITKFRRIKMWKHAGIVIPRRLEDNMHQYWTAL